MLFHFETKRRWQITIVSPNHDTVAKTARPGAISFACDSSKSPATTNNCNNRRVSASSRYPIDPVEEDWPPAYSASKPKPRSSLRRICRFLIDIHRAYDRRIVNVCDDGTPPPPYEQFRREELPASSVHEFPDPLSTTPELDGHAVMAELQGPMSSDDRHPSMCGGHHTCPPHFDAANPWTPGVGYVMPPPTPVQSPKLPWNLNTEQYPAPFPGMVSGGQLHKSSPTSRSPITSNLDATCIPQLYPLYDFPNGTISPQSPVSPPDDHWDGPPAFSSIHSYTSHSSFGSSLESSPTVPSSTYTGSTEQVSCPHTLIPSSNLPPFVHSAAPYAMSTQHLCVPKALMADAQGQWHGATNIPPGVFQHHEGSGWYYRPSYEPILNENRSRLAKSHDHPEERQHAVLIQAERSYYQAAQARPPRTEEQNAFPPEPCDKCNKVFHGRYRVGNLRRHVLAFHNPAALAVTIACRICERVYKRIDAKRKHEWKKHRILDSKPKKRTK